MPTFYFRKIVSIAKIVALLGKNQAVMRFARQMLLSRDFSICAEECILAHADNRA
jgi:hypothetical protein